MFRIAAGSAKVEQAEIPAVLNTNQSIGAHSIPPLRHTEMGFIIIEPEKKILLLSKEALSILSKGNEPITGTHFFKTLSKAMHQVLALQADRQQSPQSIIFKSGRRYYSIWTIPLLKHQGSGTYGVATAKRSLLILERIPMEEPNLPLLNRKFGFTPRESNIIRLLFRGRSDKLIGQALGISTETVREHMRNIRAKLGAVSRLEVVSFLLEQ